MRQFEVIAIEKGIRARFEKERTEAYHALQKTDSFNEVRRVFEKTDDDFPDQPPEHRRASIHLQELIARFVSQSVEAMDTVATKDYGNTIATSDIVLDGKVIVSSVPATHLLYLEKELQHTKTFIDHIPVQDSAVDWKYDDNKQMYRTPELRTNRTQKKQKPLSMAKATKEHAEQVQLITQDEVVGQWVTTAFTTAIPRHEKLELQDRVSNMLNAVRAARERANSVEVQKKSVAGAVLDYIFKG